MLPSTASLLLTLHLYPAVLWGEEEAEEEEEGWGRGEIRQAVQGCGCPFHCKSVGPVLDAEQVCFGMRVSVWGGTGGEVCERKGLNELRMDQELTAEGMRGDGF